MNNRRIVFDSYAVFVYFNGEKGLNLVKEVLKDARSGSTEIYLHLINWGEIYYKTYKEVGGNQTKEIIQKLSNLPIVVDDIFSIDFVKQTAKMKGKYPVSYADAFAINLAITKNAKLATGDPEIKKVSKKEPKLKLLWLG